jgi:hypothetical protein
VKQEQPHEHRQRVATEPPATGDAVLRREDELIGREKLGYAWLVVSGVDEELA